MGFTINKRGEGWYFGHGGSNWGFRCILTAHLVKGYGLAVMTNADRGGEILTVLQDRISKAYGWDMHVVPLRR